MKKIELIKQEAYMIVDNIAFGYCLNENKKFLTAINLKNLEQKAYFSLRDNKFLFLSGNMSKENTYKTMLIVERNNKRFVEGMGIWENTLNIK